MDFVDLNGQRIAWRDVGPRAAAVVLLAHPLGMNQSVWDGVAARLCADYRLVSWDLPGHGGSGSAAAPLATADLAQQAVMLLDTLGIQRAHFVGTSIGGAIGQALLSAAPARFDRVVLTNTSVVIGQPEAWRQRASRVRALGLAAMASELVDRWFGPAFKADHPAALRGWEGQLAHCDDETYAKLCELLAEADFRGQLADVKKHVNVLAGAEDRAAPPATVAALANELPQATQTTLDGVGHVPSVEAPDAFSDWLKGVLGTDSDARPPGFDAGQAVRRQVLGEEHVRKASKIATTLDAPFQDMITRLAWGELWANPDLPRRERSLITVAVLAALGRDGELQLHLEGAKRTGVSEAQLRQALMHVAVYGGVPAANHAFKLAREHGWGSVRAQA